MPEPTDLVELHPTQIILNDNEGRNYLVQLSPQGLSMFKAVLSVLVTETLLCKVSRLPAEVSIMPTINLDSI